MEVSKQLKKQIIIEIFALLFLIGVIFYAIYAINFNENNIMNQNGMVLVLDESNYTDLVICSDGEGLNNEGVTYTITNNNSKEMEYKVVITPSIKDKEVLKYIKIGNDDLYISKLVDLEKYKDGYVVSSMLLNPGYTKIHLFKYWFDLEAPESVLGKEIEFEYEIVIE